MTFSARKGASHAYAIAGTLAFASLSIGTTHADPINVLVVNERSTLHYPAYAARELGFYADEGLEVNLLPSDTTVPYVAFLSNGDADLVMLDAAQVFQAVNAGQPVSVVYEANQYAPESIAVLADSPIRGLADLKGRTVGLASDRDQITTIVALETVGLGIDDISTVVVGESGPVLATSLTNGTIDAYAGSANNLAAIEANGVPIRNITPYEVSENPGNSFVMWAPRKEELSDVVGRFLRAYAKATHAGVIDTKTMGAISRKVVPEQWEDLEIGLNLLDTAVYKTNMVRTVKRGEPQPDVWVRVQAPFVALGEIDGPLDPAEFLDDSFIDGANDYETIEVKEAIAEWKEVNRDILIP